jgi:hypothetical protein
MYPFREKSKNCIILKILIILIKFAIIRNILTRAYLIVGLILRNLSHFECILLEKNLKIAQFLKY